VEITSLVAQKAANLSTSVVIESFAIAAEGVRFEFASHDERRSWEYAHGSLPTSWGYQTRRRLWWRDGWTQKGWGLATFARNNDNK
jgi:hypothetical protein